MVTSVAVVVRNWEASVVSTSLAKLVDGTIEDDAVEDETRRDGNFLRDLLSKR